MLSSPWLFHNMFLAYIDVRPIILVIAIPLLLICAWICRRYFHFRNSYVAIAALWLFAFLTIYQFILYGPFVDQKRVVHAAATFKVREGGTSPVVEFLFKELPFGGLRTSDRDILAHVREIKALDVDIAVEITFDFGKPRGMNLAYAYVDGIIFRPEN